MKAAKRVFLFGGLLSTFFHKQENRFPTLMRPSVQVINFENFLDHHVSDGHKFKLLNMTGSFDLANEIAYHLGTKVSKVRIYTEDEGNDSYIEILENIRSKHVYIVCVIAPSTSVNEALVNLFLTISAAKRASAHKVVAILPYLPYSSQCDEKGIKKSVLLKSIIEMMEQSGVDKIITVNNYNTNSNGFFCHNLLEIDATRLCVSHYKDYRFKDLVLISMDETYIPRVVNIREGFLDSGIKSVAIGHLARSSEGEIEYVGEDIKGKQVMLIDNMIDTAQELTDAANYLKRKGAHEVYGFGVHGYITKDVRDRIDESSLKELLVTNSIPIDITNLSSKVNQISVGKMLAESIAQSCFNKTIDQLKKEGKL